MEAEEVIERLLEKGHECYRRSFSKRCPTIYRKLNRHEPVGLGGEDGEFSCWNELVTWCIAKMIQEYCPESQIEVELNGNDSRLFADLSEEDAVIVESKLKEMVA